MDVRGRVRGRELGGMSLRREGVRVKKRESVRPANTSEGEKERENEGEGKRNCREQRERERGRGWEEMCVVEMICDSMVTKATVLTQLTMVVARETGARNIYIHT